ncbi:MAG: molybdopterin molybdotransferase MoeA [Coraliomargarita sp.]
MKALITTDEAQAHIDAHLPTFPAIHCPISKCAGRILREFVTADRPLPPFNRSMMDGYAIRATEAHQVEAFTITAQAPAGAPAVQLSSQLGSCVEIMTGAVVPEDADCVVPYEVTTKTDDGRIQLKTPSDHTPGNCIHPLGSDHSEGAELLSPGCILGSREIAIAATCGRHTLDVTKMPSITLVSTGDELVDIDLEPEAHQIRRSNDVAIETALARHQINARDRIHLPDHRETSEQQLAEIIQQSNVVIITGGVSMGKKDYIPEVLDQLGLVNHFHGVKQKPGKPLGFWTGAHCMVFALPGNPLSVLASLHRYVIPALIKAMGQSEVAPATILKLDSEVRAHDELTFFLPVKRLPDNIASPQPVQNSGDLVRILASDGFVELPPAPDRSYPAGTKFAFTPWS